jgi:PII-like signaling protein
MKAVCLSLHMYELQKHQGMLLHEWILEFAKKHGLEGGSVYRAIAGYGRHGKMHEEHFFELASDVPLKIIFISERDKLLNFIDKMKTEKVNLVYFLFEGDFGIL